MTTYIPHTRNVFTTYYKRRTAHVQKTPTTCREKSTIHTDIRRRVKSLRWARWSAADTPTFKYVFTLFFFIYFKLFTEVFVLLRHFASIFCEFVRWARWSAADTPTRGRHTHLTHCQALKCKAFFFFHLQHLRAKHFFFSH